jgi:hypothetical protein
MDRLVAPMPNAAAGRLVRSMALATTTKTTTT